MHHKRPLSIILLFVLIGMLFLGLSGDRIHHSVLIFLPGSQPGSIEGADSAKSCAQCHHSSSFSRPVTIQTDWYGSMMAHSARDPIFYAALAVANKYSSPSGEYCIRCHTPMGWAVGHSKVPTGEDLIGTDFDGIQCDFCHRVGDPLNPDSGVVTTSFAVPGYGNAMNVFQRYKSTKRGPYDNPSAGHPTRLEPFLKSGNFCGSCHDISNVFHAQGQDRIYKQPHEYAPIERTYSEWYMSDYAKSDSGSCQHCHMKVEPGYGSSLVISPFRNDLRKHDLTGGNTFVPDILPDIWSDLDTGSLQNGKLRATAMLQSAATIGIETTNYPDSVIATVRVTNLTGHKLPTGYPEGRRMWLNVYGENERGDTIFKSGFYDYETADLIHDDEIKVYETRRGLTDSMANANGLPPGESFHFVLNDTILFDNRIPPKGFTNAGFAERLASPVNYSYSDGQYWDDTRYTMPAGTYKIHATLYYQTISKEYIEFLRDENVGNSNDWNQWGQKLYDAWDKRGKSTPVEMKSATAFVTGVLENPLEPMSFELFQNYPNPFNPETRFTFTISGAQFVMLKIFNIAGIEIATLLNEKKQPGTYNLSWNANGYPSGVYLARISSNQARKTIKVLLMK